MDANNAWGGGGGRFANSFESAAESYSKATGEALVLRDVTINAYANPYGDGLIFTGEPYYDPDNWLHTRLDEKFIDYNAWFKKQTDEFQSMLDIAGSADPTGFIDGLNAVIYAGRGQMVNAGISALAIIPYIGDAAKAERIAAKGGGRVFWSGGEEAMKAAANYAKANGGKTLEMTLGGRVMTILNPILPRSISNPIWNSLSTNFAKGATGSVNVFHNVNGVRLQSIWAQTEYGTLRGNNVNIFYHNVFP